MKKRIILKICCLLMIGVTGITIFGCREIEKESTLETQISNELVSSYGEDIVKSKAGIYHKNAEGFLYFFDFVSEKEVLVCNKANCKHEPWDDMVPVEKRCNAYMSGEGNLAGVVYGKNLYLFEKDMDSGESVYCFVKSNLNRDSRKILAKINMNMPWSYAQKGEKLYLAVNQSLMKKEEGVIMQDTKTKSNLYEIDLKSGKMKELLQEQENYNGEMEILTASGEELYLIYTYFETEFDGTNFEEAREQIKYYKYNIKSEKFDEVFANMENKVVRKMAAAGDCVYMILAGKENDSNMFELARYTEEKNKIVTIKNCREWPWLFSDCVIYKEVGKEQTGYFMYQNPDDKKEIKTDISNLYLKDAGEYFMVEQDGTRETKFIKKKYFLEGRETGIKIQ